MIKIPECTSAGKIWRVDPKSAAESIGFPPALDFSDTVPFCPQPVTTAESEPLKFTFSERAKEMFGRGMETEKGNGVREMQRRKEPSAKRAIGKRGHGKGAIE